MGKCKGQSMRIKVVAFASFREIIGRERELNLKDGATVREVLEELAKKNPRFKDAAFEENGAVRDYVFADGEPKEDRFPAGAVQDSL